MRLFSPPRRTVRLRLTLLYGALFLVSGAMLLGITYVLVDRATGGFYSYEGPNGRTNAFMESQRKEPQPVPPEGRRWSIAPPSESGGLSPEQAMVEDRLIKEGARRQRSEQLRQLLIQSGFALAIMAVISVVLGWLVAGRVLRRLRTITAAARQISATNLHERLALDGPGDELKDLGDTFDDLLARLEASFEAQRRFVANASHELRTPMARQRTLGQVALSDPDASVESLRAAHERILAAGEQQERVIAALLTLARGHAGIERREPFDLASLTDGIVASRLPEARFRNVTVRTALAPAVATGDGRLAERLVVNLVDNALRHNVDGGRVEIVTETRDGRAVLAVRNTGPVVPEDAICRMFQPFQRLGEERTGRGLGLGLSIVEAIAGAHDALVDTAPRPDGGLSIEVGFPTLSENGDGTAPVRPAHLVRSGRARFGGE
ncbi:sensor histidine kinase [Thermomonospora umbrina]|uniref:histidine kinase n=1 Tax=Thermomonospora umbrina TaxID=111806 RepID=A0A3D9SVF8_9ACTN|nr:HAMP domain-containing sensor histidine kinase [Thermomonospora umbrina]REE96985.1 signal transduction histidine kinase [Thermomonospora umbrina]